MSVIILSGRKVNGGYAEGEAMVTRQSLGAYGGFDINTGVGLEPEHDFYGRSMAGKILVFRSAKGSSSWSTWHQALRFTGAMPKAYIIQHSNSQTALASVVLRIPSITDLDQDPTSVISDGDWVEVDADHGIVRVTKKQ